MKQQTPLGQARGLGSARQGSEHWLRQRITAIALLPLVLWISIALAHLPSAEYSAVVAWIAKPWNTVLLLCSFGATAAHAGLGLQVIVEDYVHGSGPKLFALIAVRIGIVLFGVAGAFATLKIALGA